MKRLGLFAASIAGLASASSAAPEPLVGPWPIATPTEVMVLGTPHLSGIEHLKAGWLESLLTRLAKWNPGIITIEALSGPECRLLRHYDKSWPGAADSYCKLVETIAVLGKGATGLDMPDAEAAAEVAVATLTPKSIPAERRHMAALFAAAGNIGSAATQWLRLPAAERRAGDGVDAPLAAALDSLSVRRNENYLIAATLAARLGLERIHPTDDHLSDRIQADAPPGFSDFLGKLWSAERPPVALQAQAMEKALNGGASLLDYYRFLNQPFVGEAFVRADMGSAFAAPSAGEHGRRYVAWWEARNLRMAANVRAAIAARPGGRALVVVGSTHKPYLDAYLEMMHEVRIVPSGPLLGD